MNGKKIHFYSPFSFYRHSKYWSMRIHTPDFYLMKKILIALISIIIFYNTAYAIDYEYVAGKFLGEGAKTEQDFRLMSCTVKNRLTRGWNEKYVMSAYYAKYRQPEQWQIDIVSKTLTTDDDCPPVYFFYSESSVQYLKEQPIVKSSGNWYYSYEQYRLLWK